MLNNQENRGKKSEKIWLSIIIPVYEVEKYIAQCLDSTVRQKASLTCGIEVIVVDDGSPDDSGKIADTYEKEYPFVKVIHKQNAGVAAARNTGIEEATGEWLYFVDSDDWLAEGAIEKLYDKCRECGDSDIILLDAYRNCLQKEVPWEHFIRNASWDDEKSLRNLQIGVLYYPMLDMKTNTPLAAPWDKVFKRGFLLEHQILFRENLKVLDDMIFCMEAFGKAGKISYSKEKVYHYRYVSNSITNSYKPDRIRQDKIVWEYLQNYMDKQIVEKNWTHEDRRQFEQAYYSRIIKSYSICCRLCFFNPKNEKKIFNKITYAKDVLQSYPYREAFEKIQFENLEWKLKIVAVMGRFRLGIGIYVLHLLESMIRRLYSKN